MKRTSPLSYDRCGYLFITPYYIFFLFFVATPTFMSILLSFTDFNLISIRFTGFDNYIKLFKDKLFIVSVKNTLVYVIFTVFFTMILGLILALALNCKGLWGVRIFRSIYYMPYVISMVAVSMVWLWLYEPSSGFINEVMKLFGLPTQKWLYDEKFALGSIVVIGVWKNIGYYMTIFLAGLNNIPGYLYDAARVDGAGPIRRFIHITMPMLRPVTFFILITSTVNAFNVFEQVNVMTKGGPMNATTTIVHQIYTRAFTEYKMGYAAAQAVFLLVVVLIFTLLNFKYGNQGQDLEIG